MLEAENPDFQQHVLTLEADAVVRRERSERVAWRVALAACIVAIAAVVAVVALTPLKRVELRVVRVDKNTGYTDLVTTLDDGVVPYEAAQDKYWVGQYVETRERYGWDITGTDYTLVGLLSSPKVATDYSKYMHPDNKSSPINVFGHGGRIVIHIVSVVILDDGMAQVRFTKQESRGGQDSPPTNWVATVAYSYADLKLTEEERRKNLLGFQVTDYRVDSESVAATQKVASHG
jgi:type IV secretion system protein VirB8